jgi:hypothetical protein
MMASGRLRRTVALGVALLVVQLLGASASAELPSSASARSFNMFHEVNHPNLGGNSLAFFERRADGTTKRYAVAATHVNGFDIVDVTTPDDPETVSRYVTPGVNYHPWVQVNPVRNIVALSIEDPGVSPAHGMSNGIEFVDISDIEEPVRLGLAAPTGARLGAASAIGGPHTIRMIGNNHIYTTLPTYIIDYSSFPIGPEDIKESSLCGHEFHEDPNVPGRTYVGMCGSTGKWGVLDTTDPGKPTLVTQVRDLDIEYAHEVFPSPDSSVVGVADLRGGGQTHVRCPGGGIHFYDISGKYLPGASITNPRKLGTWFAPFTGVATNPSANDPNWASCTMHSWQYQLERHIITAGIYAGGTWVADPRAATQAGGPYAEYAGDPPGPGGGPTTWGNTTANWRSPGDYVNATQWYPFDSTVDRSLFVNGLVRGMDILEYEGPLPKKVSRLRIAASAPGGIVSGVLDRYAVLTYEGWVNKPLPGKTIEIRGGGTTVTATTAADGSFSANLGLTAGGHEVTVTWAGDEEFDVSSLTRQITV